MIEEQRVELFVLKCASLRVAVDASLPQSRRPTKSNDEETQVKTFVAQFSADLREDAEIMSEHYRLFYMLENDIRRLINDTLTEAHGPDWWVAHAPNTAKEEHRQNRQREAEFGVSSRSENELDYISFGQLGEVIRNNWNIFGGIVSNQKALGRVMYALNNLRGPIAHCGLLADDEVDRLKLTVKDWFRLLEGPK